MTFDQIKTQAEIHRIRGELDPEIRIARLEKQNADMIEILQEMQRRILALESQNPKPKAQGRRPKK